jgi:hypothetical protein
VLTVSPHSPVWSPSAGFSIPELPVYELAIYLSFAFTR